MVNEVRRQLVHLSGLAFIALAQFTGRFVASFYFFMVAFSFLLYSEYMLREQKRFLNMLKKYEQKLRDFIMRFERENAVRPFQGAFWFFFALGLTFAIFPLEVATAAGAILAVADALSTIAGTSFGRHRILENKTIEGSAAFFFGAFAVSLFLLPPLTSVTVSAISAFAELIPSLPMLKKLNSKGWLDDNLLIPLVAGLFIYIL